MTDSELEIRLSTLVREERKITEEILDLIHTADQRRLYLQRGFPNFYEWLVRGYGYSHAAAYRRIQAARLLGAVPEARAKLREGSVNLTTLAQVQGVVRKEERRLGARIAPPKTQSAPDKRSVNIPAPVRREVFQRSQGRCVYRDPTTGRACGSRWQVEVDHRLPRALGGGHQRENLRCLCRQHNLWEAERLLGTERVKGKT